MEVLNLKVTNDGTLTSLKVKWQIPSGNIDFYNITLSYQGTIKNSRRLEPQVTETQFKDLTPGRLYQVTVSCVSGELSAHKLATGRTGESGLQNIPCCPNQSLIHLRLGQNKLERKLHSQPGKYGLHDWRPWSLLARAPGTEQSRELTAFTWVT